jgi:hypothetical protein
MQTTPTNAGSSTASIALLLPLSERLREVGEAVRDGFIAANLLADPAQRPTIRIYDTTTDAVGRFRQALTEGATLVVGPLGKDQVLAIRSVADGRVPVLALNALPDSEQAPARFFQFALSPEDEARAVAERVIADGNLSGVALTTSSDWGTRVQNAFQSQYLALGGKLALARSFQPNATDFSDSVVEILGFEGSQRRHDSLVALLGMPLQYTPRRRDDVDFVFYAGPPVAARLIRQQFKFHYAPDLQIYATSDAYDPNPVANQDLDGVMFVDMPWMLAASADITTLRNEIQQAWPENPYQNGRLFAMGIDAWRLARALPAWSARPDDSITGVTGQLTLDRKGRVHRRLEWSVIAPDGSARPLPPSR